MAAAVRFNKTEAYAKLQAHAQQIRRTHLRQLFHQDSKRAEKLSVMTEHLYFDYSRQLVTATHPAGVSAGR